MRASLTATSAVLLVLVGPMPAGTADDLAPVAQCSTSDIHKFVTYEGFAYTPSTARTPERLTLSCAVESYWERHVTTQTIANSPAVALAWVVVAFKADPMTVCATAVAEYTGGPTLSTTKCGQIGEQ